MRARYSAIFLLSTVTCAALGQVSASGVWSKLKSGPYACGFRSEWKFDYGHRYQPSFAAYGKEKRPRPILMNVWYPAKAGGTPMRFRDYYKIVPKEKELGAFATALRDYALGVAVEEIFGKETKELTKPEQRLWEVILSSPSNVVRDAKAASGRFPVVIYHSGYGSSFADSTVMCEYLASRGFVVIGTAYQQLDGAGLNIEGKEGSGQDVRFLVNQAAQMRNVDWSRVGYVGHSGGAQAGILFQTMPGCVVDATVALDTTEDYYSLADPRWDYMVKPARKEMASMTRPILFMADPTAGFEFVDSLTKTPRYLFTSDALSHNDYISHGSFGHWVKGRLGQAPDEKRIWDRYAQVCQVTGDFLAAQLKGETKDFEARLASDGRRGLVADGTTLVSVPVGVAGPDAYSGSGFPTPRQVRPFLREKGVAALIEAFDRVPRPAKGTAYSQVFAFSLVFQLADEGKAEEARQVHAAFGRLGLPTSALFLSQGKFYKKVGSREFATKCFRHLLVLEPGNEEAKKELEAMAG